MLLRKVVFVFVISGTAAFFPLEGIMRATDELYESSGNGTNEEFKELMGRSHELLHPRQKRENSVYNDFQRIDGFDNVIFKDSIFPVDLNYFESDGKSYFISLYDSIARGGESNKPLARIYEFDNVKHNLLEWEEMESVGKVEVQKFNRDTIIAITQPPLGNFTGNCLIYVFHDGRPTLTQTLVTGSINDLKMALHYDEVLLAIARESDVSIYKWLGSYFDHIQLLDNHEINALSFYNIDNIFFLSTVGKSRNEDTSCWIWEFSASTKSFVCRQNAEPYSAIDAQYFKVRGRHYNREKHFLAVAYDKASSVIYKIEDSICQPFQIFDNKKVSKWLPYESSRTDNALFALTETGLEAYFYDGWRFQNAPVLILNTSFHQGCQFLRRVETSDDTLLVGINHVLKVGEVVKPSFHLTIKDESLSQMSSWCETLINPQNNSIERLEKLINSAPTWDQPLSFKGNVVFHDVSVAKLITKSFGSFNKELVDEINGIYKMLNDVESIRSDVEHLFLTHSSDVAVVRGPVELRTLRLNCNLSSPCFIDELTTRFLNNEPVDEFLANTVSLKDGINTDAELRFFDLRVRKMSADAINGHPAENLIVTTGDLDLPEMRINGNLTFQGDVRVKGEIQGVVFDQEHVVLADGNQTLIGSLILNNASFDHLQLNGELNSGKINAFFGEDELAQVPVDWETLNVLNLTLDGYLAGHHISKNLNLDETLVVESVNISSGKLSDVDIADLVLTSGGRYNLGDVTFLDQLQVDNLNVVDSVNDIKVDTIHDPLTESNCTGVGNENTLAGDSRKSDNARDVGYYFESVQSLEESYFSNEDYDDTSDGVGYDDDFVCGDDLFGSDTKLVKRLDENGKLIYEVEGPLTVDSMHADNLIVTGSINDINWTEVVNDAVRKDEPPVFTGKVTIVGELKDVDLNVDGFINGLQPEEFVKRLTSSPKDESNVNHTVEDIIVNGKSIFEDNDEIVTVDHVKFLDGVSVEFLNNVDVEDFIANIVLTDQNTTLLSLNFIDTLQMEEIEVSGLVNSGKFSKDVLFLNNSNETQKISGRWSFNDDLSIEGSLIVNGEVNGVKLEKLCEMTQKVPRIIVAGSVKSLKEPIIHSINSIHKSDLFSNIWLSDRKAKIDGNVKISMAQFWNTTTLKGRLNGYTMDNLSTGYLSKTISRFMKAPLFITNLTVNGKARAKNVTGRVNNINLVEFAASVLQYDIPQNFTVTPHFEEVNLTALNSGLVDDLDFSKDVLRYDVEKAVITGTKKIENLITEQLFLSPKVQLQGVNMLDWARDAVLKSNPVISGNVTFHNIHVDGILTVEGEVGPLKFDTQNLLTTRGNQKVLAPKTFLAPMEMSSLEGNGLINNVNIRELIKSASYTNQSISLASPVEVENMAGLTLTVKGNVAGVNVSEFCDLPPSRLTINDLNNNYLQLTDVAQKIHNNIAHGAYYLDSFKVVQKFKTNVSALAALPGEDFALAVFREFGYDSNVTVLQWDPRGNDFRHTQDNVIEELSGNVTWVASGSNYLFSEKWGRGGQLFFNTEKYFVDSNSSTCAVPFKTTAMGTCLFLGQDSQPDKLYCTGVNSQSMQVIQQFKTINCVQAAAVKTHKKTWIAVIGNKVSRPSTEIFVTVLSVRDEQKLVYPRQDLPVLHPVSVAVVSHRKHSYLVVASKHQPESVRSSVLSVFRYSNQTDKWVRYQEIPVDAPIRVSLEELPTGQLALYVLTANPARVFLVFLYKGLEGFVEEIAGFATHSGSILSAFNIKDNHFVAIAGNEYGQLLQAELAGRRFA